MSDMVFGLFAASGYISPPPPPIGCDGWGLGRAVLAVCSRTTYNNNAGGRVSDTGTSILSLEIRRGPSLLLPDHL
jgi:hypothetical protein